MTAAAGITGSGDHASGHETEIICGRHLNRDAEPIKYTLGARKQAFRLVNIDDHGI